LHHELESVNLELTCVQDARRQQHDELTALLVQLDQIRLDHQLALAEQQSAHESACRDLENQFETRLNEQIADGLRRRQNLLDEFNKAQDQMKSRLTEARREREGQEAKIGEKERQLKSVEAELRAVRANQLVKQPSSSDQVQRRYNRFRFFSFKKIVKKSIFKLKWQIRQSRPGRLHHIASR
jgi:chromosome segregation ATPase